MVGHSRSRSRSRRSNRSVRVTSCHSAADFCAKICVSSPRQPALARRLADSLRCDRPVRPIAVVRVIPDLASHARPQVALVLRAVHAITREPAVQTRDASRRSRHRNRGFRSRRRGVRRAFIIEISRCAPLPDGPRLRAAEIAVRAPRAPPARSANLHARELRGAVSRAGHREHAGDAM